MGGRGGNGSRNSKLEPIEMNASISQLEKYTDWKTGPDNIRKDFNLDFATNSQIESIRKMIKGILQYDYAYHEKDKPFNIVSFRIEKLASPEREDLKKDKTILVSITTRPNVDSAYIRMVDTKYRSGLLGPRGSFYTFNDKHKRVSIREFDMEYGTNKF